MVFFNKQYNLRIYEDFNYNYQLDYISKFNSINKQSQKNLNKIILNFGFKHIKFEKKKMVLFFLILELIANQKCILTTSKKNIIFLRLKKGSITGCKLTLRNKNLYEFLDTLLLSWPRTENFNGLTFNLNSKKQYSFTTKIENLFIFYQLETEITSFIKKLDVTFNFNTYNDFEKIFILTYNKIPLNLKNNN